MSRFEEDKYREGVLGKFLMNQLYPRIATDFERVNTAEKQKVGHDVIVDLDWLPEPVVVDEKAQVSDRWLNSPSPTFVMEIFGESWLSNGTPDGNIGWFVNKQNESEYYVLVWLPSVSVFKLTPGIDEAPYLVYQPSKFVDFSPDQVAETTQSTVRHKLDSSKGEYRIRFTSEAVEAFETVVEPLPDIINTNRRINYGEWYYDPHNIYEAKVALVEKEKIQTVLAEDGLTRDTLLRKGRRAVEETKVDIDSDKAKYILRSGGEQSGSADDEDPVVLVVNYDTYHEIADRTFHYADGSWSENAELF